MTKRKPTYDGLPQHKIPGLEDEIANLPYDPPDPDPLSGGVIEPPPQDGMQTIREELHRQGVMIRSLRARVKVLEESHGAARIDEQQVEEHDDIDQD